MNTDIHSLVIGICAGGTDSLLKLNLSFINLKFIKFNNTTSEKFLSSLKMESGAKNKAREYFDMVVQEIEITPESLYLLVPIKIDNTVAYETFDRLSEILLIMFPSNFKLVGRLDIRKDGNGYHPLGFGLFPYRADLIQKPWDAYLTIGDGERRSVIQFVKHYFKRYETLKYLRFAIDYYIFSFRQRPLATCFTSLSIALEAITNSRSEVTYQIARCCAVINSNTSEEGNRIFEVTKKLYNMRSDIVHGNKFDVSALISWYPNLEAMTSRTLCELIGHEIENKDVLSSKITSSGFGKKRQLSSSYVAPNFNKKNQSLILEKTKTC